MAKKTYTKLTNDKIAKIHQLLGYGLSQSQTAKAVEISNATVSRLCASGAKNIEEYKAWNKLMHKPRTSVTTEPVATEQEAEEVNPPEVQTFFYTPEEQVAVELTRIANALERLADAWESTPTKKKGFF